MNTDKMNPLDPIEIRLDRDNASERNRPPYVLIAWRTPQGTVAHSLEIGGDGMPHSLSNLQSKGTFPRKAVQGWQSEVVDFAFGGLFSVIEVR